MTYKVISLFSKCLDCGKNKKSLKGKKCRSCSKKGSIVSVNTRKKISDSLIGKCVNSKEHYKKLSRLFTGKKQSKEHNLAISKGLTGRKLSEETKEKLRKCSTKNWEDCTEQTKHWKIRELYGKADRCESKDCKGICKQFKWSNVSGKYLEDKNDWQRLCSACHGIYYRKWRVHVQV